VGCDSILGVSTPSNLSEPLVLPTDPAAIAALFLAERAARLAEREARTAAEARAERAEAATAQAMSEAAEAKSEASNARTAASASEAMIAHLKLDTSINAATGAVLMIGARVSAPARGSFLR
jgi:hypothetical protein